MAAFRRFLGPLPARPEKQAAQTGSLGYPLLLAFALRLGLSLWLAVVWLVVDRRLPAGSPLAGQAFFRLSPHASLLERMFLDVWARWDAVHYLNIARFGYGGLGDLNYFPLFPYTVRLVSWLTGMDVFVGGLLVSSLAAAAAFVLLYRLVLEAFENQSLAFWTVLLWAVYPTSLFLFAPYTDSLFMVFALASLLALRRDRWVPAGVWAALAGLTRAQGLLLLLPIAFRLGQMLVDKKPIPWRSILAGLGIAPLGFLAFSLWRSRSGLPSFADSFAQYSGVHFANPLTNLQLAVWQAFEAGEVRLFLEVISLVGFGLVLGWMLSQVRFRRAPELLVYALATLVLFLSKNAHAASVYQSAPRYVLSLFPAFIGAAALALKLPAAWQKRLVFASLFGLLVVSTFYALFFFVG